MTDLSNRNPYIDLAWIYAGLIVWFVVREVSPRVAGLILTAMALSLMVVLGPLLAKIPKPK